MNRLIKRIQICSILEVLSLALIVFLRFDNGIFLYFSMYFALMLFVFRWLRKYHSEPIKLDVIVGTILLLKGAISFVILGLLVVHWPAIIYIFAMAAAVGYLPEILLLFLSLILSLLAGIAYLQLYRLLI